MPWIRLAWRSHPGLGPQFPTCEAARPSAWVLLVEKDLGLGRVLGSALLLVADSSPREWGYSSF